MKFVSIEIHTRDSVVAPVCTTFRLSLSLSLQLPPVQSSGNVVTTACNCYTLRYGAIKWQNSGWK